MKVVAFKANDGELFESEQDCIDHNTHLNNVEELESMFSYDGNNPFYIHGEIRLDCPENLVTLVNIYEEVFRFILGNRTND